MRGAESLTAAAGGFVVFLLSMPVVQGQDGWAVTYTPTEICALRGSTVDMRCTYTYPSSMNGLKTTVEEATWFVKMSRNEPVDLTTDPQYSGRVDVQCGDNDCTLRITDLRESDSAEYKFRFITNQPRGRYTGRTGVTLSVTDLQVKKVSLTDSYGFPSEALKCHSSCRLPDNSVYIWYKNGHKIQEETLIYSGDFDPADSYSCAIKGNEDFPSPSMCVRGQSCNKVTYDDRRICAVKGSSVDISCTYNKYNRYESIRSKLWFSPGQSLQWQSPSQLDSQHRVQVLDEGGGRSTLRISDLRESYSAEYRFTFTAGSFEWGRSLPATTLTVTDPDLQVQVRPSSSSSRAELTCHSSCRLPARPSYVWYKNGEKIQTQTSSSYSVYFGYADSYSCAVAGHEDSPSPPVCVRGQSCNKVTYADRRICAVKGSSVDISCTYNSYYSYNRYIRSKLWFSPGRSLQWQSPSQLDSQRRVQVLDEGGGRSTLRISDLRESDSAEYRFTFTAGSFEWGRSLPATTLTVTALQVQVTSKRVHQHYTEAELKCQSSCGPADRLSYVWFKNRVEIKKEESSSYKSRFYPRDFVFCALKGHEAYSSPSVYGPKLPSVSVSPSAEIVEGSSVTLSCSSDANPAANYTWYKTNGNGVSFKSQLVFSSIQSSDSGQYYCTAENELGRTTSESISVDVKYGPKLPSVSVSPSAEIVEGSSVTLSCSSDANPAAEYIWYKENQKLMQGTKGIHLFKSISSEDRGNYFCKAGNQFGELGSKSVFLNVQYGPKLPSVSVSPSAEIVEGSSVTLSCSSDANPAANYTWYKTNGNGVSFKSQLVFSSIQSSDSGQYYCTAENELGRTTSESISVDVKYGPKLPSVSVSPSAEIVEGSSVTLSCSSDANPAANYIWYKENEDSPKASGQKFTITDVRAEHSGSYSCEAQNIRGSHRNTLHLTVVAGAWRSISAGITTAVILAVVLFFLFKLTRKKRVPNQSSDPTEKPHNWERYVPTRGQPDDQQDDLHYASVHFSTNHTDCLYSNIRPAGLHRDEQEREDDSIEYAVVKFNRGSKGPRTQKTPKKDSAELYSTINKSC